MSTTPMAGDRETRVARVLCECVECSGGTYDAGRCRREAIAQALVKERARAVAYLRVLKANHPNYEQAYEHAAKNLDMALQTSWEPPA